MIHYSKARLKVYYGHKNEYIPSTTLAGALIQFYALYGEKIEGVKFGFSDFKVMQGRKFFQNRVMMGREYYYSFPYITERIISKRRVYGEYEGCIIGDISKAKEEVKKLILVNFSELIIEDDIKSSEGELYAIAIPVKDLNQVSELGDVVRVRVLRFHSANEIKNKAKMYVLDNNELKDVSQIKGLDAKRIIIADVRLNKKRSSFNVLEDMINKISDDPLIKAYMFMAHGVVVPSECYEKDVMLS